MLIEDENSDDDFFKYKITERDYQILQYFVGQRQQFGLMEQVHQQQQEQLWPERNQVNVIGNIDEEQEMIVD